MMTYKKAIICLLIICLILLPACTSTDMTPTNTSSDSQPPDGSAVAQTDFTFESAEYERFLWIHHLFYLVGLTPVEMAATSDMDDLSITQYCLKLMLDKGASFPWEANGFSTIPLDIMQEYAEKYLGISEYLPASLPTVPLRGSLSAAFDRQARVIYALNDASLSALRNSKFAAEHFRRGGVTDLGSSMISAKVEFMEPDVGLIRSIDYVFDASDPENPVFVRSTETWLTDTPALTGEYLRLSDYNYYTSEYIPDNTWLTVRYVPYMITLSLVDMQSGEVIKTASHEYSSGPKIYDMMPETFFTANAIVVRLEDGLRLFGYDLSNMGFIPTPEVLTETEQIWDYTFSPDLKAIAFTDSEGGEIVSTDGSEPPHLILAHPGISMSDDGTWISTLNYPRFLLGGELVVYNHTVEGRMLGQFYAAGLSGENGSWYDTGKDIPWYKNFYLYAGDEWLVTPRIEGNLAAISLRTGEARVIGNESANAFADESRMPSPVSSGHYLAFTEQEGDTIHLYLYDWASSETVYTGFSITKNEGLHANVHLGAVDESGRVLITVFHNDAFSTSRTIIVSPLLSN